jgi:hypothetical protein
MLSEAWGLVLNSMLKTIHRLPVTRLFASNVILKGTKQPSKHGVHRYITFHCFLLFMCFWCHRLTYIFFFCYELVIRNMLRYLSAFAYFQCKCMCVWFLKSSNSLNARWKFQFIVLRTVCAQWAHQRTVEQRTVTEPLQWELLTIARIMGSAAVLVSKTFPYHENPWNKFIITAASAN